MRVSQPAPAADRQGQDRPAYGTATATLVGSVKRRTLGSSNYHAEANGTYGPQYR
jgi:hypothetical protein